MYESRYQPLLSRAQFHRRILKHAFGALALLLFSVGLGMTGYAATEGMSAIDAFLNTTMLLGGMGPVNAPLTFGGKLFAGLFALYAGLVFIVCAALVATPVLHRVLHHFHVDED